MSSNSVINNLIISGGIFHDFPDTSQALAEIMAPQGIRSTIETDIDKGLRGLAQGDYKMLTVNALRWQMLDDKYDQYRDESAFSLSMQGREVIASFVREGNSLFGLHTASICFDDWPEWQAILGGVWRWGRSYHPPLGTVNLSATGSDPIVAGCQSFSVQDEAYSDLDVLPSVEPLLLCEHPSPNQPLCWKHRYGKGRIIYDALGHDRGSLEQLQHRQLIRNAVDWLLKGNSYDEID